MLPRDTWAGYQLNAPEGLQPQRFYKKTIHPTIYTRLENPWKDLHSGVVCDQASLEKWESKIPGYGCQCRRDYALYKASNPPDFSSPEALWIWGFNLHNWVNRKLGKPELTVEEAKALWRSEDGEEIKGEGVGGESLQ